MILIEEIEITLRNRDIPYYKNLGYIIPKNGKYGRVLEWFMRIILKTIER
jgi:hypothetical protein